LQKKFNLISEKKAPITKGDWKEIQEAWTGKLAKS